MISYVLGVGRAGQTRSGVKAARGEHDEDEQAQQRHHPRRAAKSGPPGAVAPGQGEPATAATPSAGRSSRYGLAVRSTYYLSDAGAIEFSILVAREVLIPALSGLAPTPTTAAPATATDR